MVKIPEMMHAFRKHNHPLREAYERDFLDRNRRYIGAVAFASGLANLLLIIPDMLHITGTEFRPLVTGFRALLGAGMLIMAVFCYRKKEFSYRAYTVSVTMLEAASIGVFLFIFSLYDPPHFIIQAMGLMVIVMAIFVVPNSLRLKIGVSLAGIISFLFLSRMIIGNGLTSNEFWAGTLYLLAAFGLCAFFSYNLEKYQFLEYQAKRQLIQINTIDTLTGAYNRNKLFESWHHWSSYCRRHRQPLTLVLFDIDNFKQINDEHGHLKADEVLIESVLAIQKMLRDTDVLARWGGDEFVILLPGTTGEEAVRLLHRIRNTLRGKKRTHMIPIRCSFGVAEMVASSNLGSLIQEADSLMYQAKRSGGDHIQIKGSEF